MLHIDNIQTADLRKIRTACAYLFSPEAANDNRFIKGLNLELVKKAFREKAKRYHPDSRLAQDKKMLDRRKERFIKVRESYEVVASFLGKESSPFRQDDGGGRARTIAVGGAKGGIGKTIFAANLGVLLSSWGLRPVVADLDLGGANLHLYLGETSLKRNINDFLDKRASSLNHIMTRTRYGPRLIGGESSHLGAANISFVRKLRLLKAIKDLAADYVIIDLGGDTSYNILDFFLGADHGIVMTTCQPASYLDAYNFIKTALFRKLNRLFGPEARSTVARDRDLERLILEETMTGNGSQPKTINRLVERVRREQPGNVPLIMEAISTFSPYLVVNGVTRGAGATQVVGRIQEVSAKMLSVKIRYLGSLPQQAEVEASVRDLVPIVWRYPDGDFAGSMTSIVKKLSC